MTSISKPLKWDYTEHSKTYTFRPDYAPSALEDIFRATGVAEASPVCEIGAGDGHLTLHLAAKKFQTHAIEPNEAMREVGKKRTVGLEGVSWSDGTGEETGKPGNSYQLVIFGSSFNVTDRQAALKEASRILKPKGWFACLWNHRNLDDPLQVEIEAIIGSHVPGYSLGTRREDQTDIIAASGLFGASTKIEGTVTHQVDAGQWLQAWTSHATLARQAGNALPAILRDIEKKIRSLGKDTLAIPYTTRAWIAPVLKQND
jgi:SAM-dependent methyltransferase